MNYIRKAAVSLTIAVFAGVSLVPATAGAGPFTGSKQDACKGAGLGSPGCGDQPAKKLSDRAKTIVNILSAIVGIVAVIMLIIGGFRYITAGGDSNSINSAKNTIIYALVGAVIATLAQVIVRFVLSRF